MPVEVVVRLKFQLELSEYPSEAVQKKLHDWLDSKLLYNMTESAGTLLIYQDGVGLEIHDGE